MCVCVGVKVFECSQGGVFVCVLEPPFQVRASKIDTYYALLKHWQTQRTSALLKHWQTQRTSACRRHDCTAGEKISYRQKDWRQGKFSQSLLLTHTHRHRHIYTHTFTSHIQCSTVTFVHMHTHTRGYVFRLVFEYQSTQSFLMHGYKERMGGERRGGQRDWDR